MPRYTNGAPDIGYYYGVLDYTIANLFVAGGSVNVLPGTAIGIRNDFITNSSGPVETLAGFYVYQGGSITSHGTPNKPNVFVYADLVQEMPNTNAALVTDENTIGLYPAAPSILSFLSGFELGDSAPPTSRLSLFQSFICRQQICNFALGSLLIGSILVGSLHSLTAVL